jgi:DNA-binding transcriptional regulator YiaG
MKAAKTTQFDLAEAFRAGQHLDVDALRAYLAMTQQNFAAMLRVHRNTLESMPTSTKVQAGARDALRVLSAIIDAGSDQPVTTLPASWPAYFFVNLPLPSLRYRQAPALLTNAVSCDADVDLIVDAVRAALVRQ